MARFATEKRIVQPPAMFSVVDVPKGQGTDMKKLELVKIKRDKATVSSLEVAEHFCKRHRDVMRAIENVMHNVSEDFNERNFALATYIDAKGEKRKCYEMTRDGFSMVVMGFTGKKAYEWKEKYIQAFNTMEKIITEKQTEAWIESRQKGKLARKSETAVIKQLVEYAKEQGSSHADMLYMTYTKLANKYAGITNRDTATVVQLNQLFMYENIAENLMKEGMKQGLNYKEIYQITKERFEIVQNIAYLKQAN